MSQSKSGSGDGPAEGGRDFRATHWSVVLMASGPTSPQSAQALERLCRAYWYPIYAFVRHRGHGAHEAQDLTQGFFAKLLEKNYLEAAEAEKGRFRTFLITAVTRFLANEFDRTRTLKRGGGQAVFSLDEQDAEGRYLLEPASELTPETIYQQQWAERLLEIVMDRLRAEFRDAGPRNRFEELKVFLLEPKGMVTYADAAARLGLTESAVKSGIHRMRHRYRELLREEIAQTVGTASEVDEEIRHLLAALEN